MNIGMLWFDNDPKVSLDTKVERAASYYRNKYGRSPNVCFVHPTMLTSTPSRVMTAKTPPTAEPGPDELRYVSGGVEVRSNRSVLPNHFWIGVNS